MINVNDPASLDSAIEKFIHDQSYVGATKHQITRGIAKMAGGSYYGVDYRAVDRSLRRLKRRKRIVYGYGYWYSVVRSDRKLLSDIAFELGVNIPTDVADKLAIAFLVSRSRGGRQVLIINGNPIV